MNDEIITPELENQVLRFFETETSFKRETIAFEIQDDGQFLLISISIDDLPETEPVSTFRRVGDILNSMVPSRIDDYSWTVVFTKAGKVVDSYFGGNSASPDSGL